MCDDEAAAVVAEFRRVQAEYTAARLEAQRLNAVRREVAKRASALGVSAYALSKQTGLNGGSIQRLMYDRQR